MNDLILYKNTSDLTLYKELKKLFAEWKDVLTTVSFQPPYTANNFICDGFYPFYRTRSSWYVR
ncbi:MAG: hypothetical protein P1P64_03260 [Treponemataceae bacterium]